MEYVLVLKKINTDQAVQWLGKPAAAPKVPGSNPGKGMDVKLSVLGPING